MKDLNHEALMKWAAASIAAFWASFPVAFQVLVVLMVADFVTGWIKGGIQRNLSSDISRRGALKKGQALVIMAILRYVEVKMKLNVGAMNVVAVAFAFTELVSIVENAYQSGVPIPAALVEVLVKAKTFKSATPEQMQMLSDKEKS